MNRIALVTGASRGIGRACALELVRAGYRVALAARQTDKLEEVAAEVRAAGGEAYVVALDLASQESIKAGFAKVSAEFGRIEVLVNNAGMNIAARRWDVNQDCTQPAPAQVCHIR